MEIALGAAIQNIVAQDEGAAKRAIALLKERGAGRATFLPLTNLKANPVRKATWPPEAAMWAWPASWCSAMIATVW